MHKLVPVLALIATVPISIKVLVAAELHSAGPLSVPAALGIHGPSAVVLVGGMGGGGAGGGMGGGGMGGMGAGSMGGGGMGGGGMGAGTMGGGMGVGRTGGGMGGGTTGGGNLPQNSVEPANYTYECVTPGGQCFFAAPAALRSSSLRAGARCSCSQGQAEGRV